MSAKSDKIREFQRMLGVEDDGKWGPITEAAYQRYLRVNNVANKSPYGKNNYNFMGAPVAGIPGFKGKPLAPNPEQPKSATAKEASQVFKLEDVTRAASDNTKVVTPVIKQNNKKETQPLAYTNIQAPDRGVIRPKYEGSFEEREYYRRKDNFERNNPITLGAVVSKATDPLGIRGAIVPESVKGLTEKIIFNTHIKDNDTYNQLEKAIMYKAGEQAQKRTGKQNTGIEYQDILAIPGLKEDEKAAIKALVAGKGMKYPMASFTSAAYNVASSMGQWSVAGTKDGKQFITDNYEFTNDRTIDPKTGRTKEGYMSTGNTISEHIDSFKKDPLDFGYRNLRRSLAKRDDDLTEKELAGLKTGIALSPRDTVGFNKMQKTQSAGISLGPLSDIKLPKLPKLPKVLR